MKKPGSIKRCSHHKSNKVAQLINNF